MEKQFDIDTPGGADDNQSSNPSPFEDPQEPLHSEQLEQLQLFKRKLTAYKKSYPERFQDLDWSVLETQDIDAIEDLYNEVQLDLNHCYQKGSGFIGVAYQSAMSGLEYGAKFTNGMVMLDGLSSATAKNKEIRDILTQINIETGCYDSVQSPELRLAVATLNMAVQVHMLNQRLQEHPELLQSYAKKQSEELGGRNGAESKLDEQIKREYDDL